MTQLHDTADSDAGGSQPTVSVVIPAYNAEKTIRRALASVAAQTYDNIIETIIVDDGSGDETAQIIRDEYPHVRLFEQPNQGSAVARNRGATEASGHYVAFLDADDEWLPEKTSQQADFHTRFPGAILSISNSREAGTAARRHTDESIRALHLRFRDVVNVYRGGLHYGCSGWFVERETFQRVGGYHPEFKRGQDLELLWRLTLEGYSAVFIEEELFLYHPSWTRRTPEDARNTTVFWDEMVSQILEEYLNRDGDRPFAWLSDDEREQIIADSLLHRASQFRAIGAYDRMRELLREHLRHRPLALSPLLQYLASYLPAPLLSGVARVFRRTRSAIRHVRNRFQR